MKTREEILAYILNTTENTVKYYRNEMIVTPKQALDAMHQYAMEKADEINKLNKSDVISSVCEKCEHDKYKHSMSEMVDKIFKHHEQTDL